MTDKAEKIVELVTPENIDRQAISLLGNRSKNIPNDAIGAFLLTIYNDHGRQVYNILAPEEFTLAESQSQYPVFVLLFDCLAAGRTYLDWTQPTDNKDSLKKIIRLENARDDFAGLFFWVEWRLNMR